MVEDHTAFPDLVKLGRVGHAVRPGRLQYGRWMARRDRQPIWPALLLVSSDSGLALHSTVADPPWESLTTPTHPLTLDSLRLLARWRDTGDLETAARSLGVDQADADSLEAVLDRFGVMAAPVEMGSEAGREDPVAADPTTVTAAETYVFPSPQVWRVGLDCFERFDHEGTRRCVLSPEELHVASAFAQPTAPEGATADPRVLDVVGIVTGLIRRGVLVPAAAKAARASGPQAEMEDLVANYLRLRARMTSRISSRHAESDAASEIPKIAVYPVLATGADPPLALGTILARAASWEGPGIAENYDLFPRWIDQSADVSTIPDGPAIFLFSDYIWSHQGNLDFSRRLKEANPRAVTMHGGPDCPAYELDTVAYHHHHPYVDVAVRGEGEETACAALEALGPSLRAGNPDLGALADVAGLSYRNGDQVISTPDRDRMTDLDVVPSPYTADVFELFAELPTIDMAILETNRGCPYGCTFCDWGSATNSRIRKLSLERVFEDLDWIATNRVKRLFIADANFGIFSRDVEIAQRIADLKEQHGFPERVLTNYAKNTVKHLKQIVQIISTAGIVTEGLLSLQSMDEATLSAIRRSNIKLDKYEALASEFRSEDLPLFVDLMMGLPGQTLDSLRADLQQCVDREVLAKCHGTELLVNSPMNDPSYREEYEIETSRPPGPLSGTVPTSNAALVVSSSSFTRHDYSEMHRMRRSYLLGENLGVVRFVSRFVRHTTGIREVDFIERLRLDSQENPARWPVSRLVTATIPDAMVPPISWRFFTDELRCYLTEVLEIADDTALATVLAVQHAVLPAPGREFPHTVELEHDFEAWHEIILTEKLDGHLDDWETVTPPLSSFEPATLVVTDPHEVCAHNLSRGSAVLAYNDWELQSPVSRPVPTHHSV
jgi:Radical SAM superfamily